VVKREDFEAVDDHLDGKATAHDLLAVDVFALVLHR